MTKRKLQPAPISRRVVGPSIQPPQGHPEAPAATPPPAPANDIAPSPPVTPPPAPQPAQAPQPEVQQSPPATAAKRAGRPRKDPGEKVLPINLTMAPEIHAKVDSFLDELNALLPVDMPKSQLVAFAIRELISDEPENVLRRLVASRKKPEK